MNADQFFDYARERHHVMLQRDAGVPWPWTKDPILQEYRFCNVFREDDKTTRWLRENVRAPLVGNDMVLRSTLIFRWFNRVETGEILLGNMPDGRRTTNLMMGWSSTYARARLQGVKPLVTGAYIIKTPDGKTKLEGILWCIEEFLQLEDWILEEIKRRGTLQAAQESLRHCRYMGPFMAYEVVTDLRHTHLLDQAPDIMTWANPGPGCARGLGRVLHNDPARFSRNSIRDQADLQEGMQYLLAMSQHQSSWPSEWPRWEMRDVEHTLCEFDKYERARLGEGRPKQRFDRGATG